MYQNSVIWMDDTLGVGGEVKAARARVRCARAKIKEVSPVLTAHGASYHIKGRCIVLVFRVC